MVVSHTHHCKGAQVAQQCTDSNVETEFKLLDERHTKDFHHKEGNYNSCTGLAIMG
jgi:hypothetical protein